MTIKKEYKTPQMTVLDMKFKPNLLSCSDCDAPEAKEYDDEFGFNSNPENNRHV